MSKSYKNIIINTAIVVAVLLLIHCFSLYFIYAAKGAKIQYINIDKLVFVARILVELLLTASLLYLGFWIANKKQNYVLLIRSVILAYWVFVLQYLAECIWLFFTKEHYSLFEINSFSSFSLLAVVGAENTPLYLHYPLTVVNLWELLFIAALGFLLMKRTNLPPKNVFLIVVCSYILPLIAWVCAVSYINMLNTM